MAKYYIIIPITILLIYLAIVSPSLRLPDRWKNIRVGDRATEVMAKLNLKEENLVPNGIQYEVRLGTRRKNPMYPFTHRLKVVFDKDVVADAKVVSVEKVTEIRYYSLINFSRD